MIPAALPVVPISLLARYVVTILKREKGKKKGEKEKRNQRNQTAFYFSFQIIHSEQHLSSAYACLCVYVSQTWQVGGSLVVHVHSIKKCIFVVVVHGSLFVVVCCTLPEKSDLMDTTCLLVDASYAVKLRILTLPPQKGGKKKKKKRKEKENRQFPCSVRIYSRRISMRFHSARNGSDSGH